MSEKVAQERPAPTVDQIWRCQVGHGCHFEITIGAVKDGVVWPVNTRDLPQAIVSLTQARWSCIGLVTPHGRVMVGEVREGDVTGALFTVTGIAGTNVIVSYRGVSTQFAAHAVARWPLISPPSPAAEPTEADRMAEMGEGFPGTSGALARRLRSADPREQGPGISRLPPPEARPDVVVTAAWERWSLP